MIHIPAFAPIQLPATALLRTWFTDLIANEGLPYAFRGILANLARDVYDALPDKSCRACYEALVNWLHNDDRLPLDYTIFQTLENENEYGDIEGQHQYWTGQIYLQLYGYSPAELESMGSAAHALILYDHEDIEAYENAGMLAVEALAPHKSIIPVYDTPPQTPAPPRGRKWLPPWDALPELIDWTTSQTGLIIMDVCTLDVDEGGADLPPWTVTDIQFCIDQYQRAKPIMARASRLAEYIDDRPAERLPMLRHAMHGHKPTLHDITVPLRTPTVPYVAPRKLIDILVPA